MSNRLVSSTCTVLEEQVLVPKLQVRILGVQVQVLKHCLPLECSSSDFFLNDCLSINSKFLKN